MSEIRLNLVDSNTILTGTLPASIGDLCVAALSAEPETIYELQAALERFRRDTIDFRTGHLFVERAEIDNRPYDAGILIIDLAARIVAFDSTYSLPTPNGQVFYHDGKGTDIPIFYSLHPDWMFAESVYEYEFLNAERRATHAAIPRIDARTILYGRPLLEFIATNARYAASCFPTSQIIDPVSTAITEIHRRWLLTPRADLINQSPRDVLVANKDFIDSDLESRALQWSLSFEGPPCLPRDSHAYRFAGFGTHEWVIYYELIRHLLRSAFRVCSEAPKVISMKHLSVPLDEPNSILRPVAPFEQDSALSYLDEFINHLDQCKLTWLTEPNEELADRIPFMIIDNERKRLPEAMAGRSMVIDEDCPICKQMGDECEAGLEICFWHLDGCNMDQEFAFSSFRTIDEWEQDQRRFQELVDKGSNVAEEPSAKVYNSWH